MAPLETGGVLLGYVAGADEPVVTEVIGPGPGAVHDTHRFVPDHEYQVSAIERHYHASGRRLDYLGDWHTHPTGPAELSGTDLAALRAIAEHPAARVPKPVMLVLSAGPAWEPTAWRGTMRGRTWLRRRLFTAPLPVRVYQDGV
jgi:integrative and conjugative element protein (TIGR02256 family)